jgi:CHASE1-domain containing sensor protein/tRNA A-37 threonylcarbamoyl transferase component Bud32
MGGVVLTLAVCAGSSRLERGRAERRFQGRARQVAAAVREEFEAPLEVLYSIPAFFAASEEVTRSEFREFVSGALARHPSVYAFEWAPFVTAEERSAYEARARADGLTSFAFRDAHAGAGAADGGSGGLARAPERGLYLPIYYMEPPNAVALGLDLASLPERFVAPEKACREGMPVATASFRLLEYEAPVDAVAVYQLVKLPRGGAGPDGAAAGACHGVVAVVLRLGAVMETVLQVWGAEGFDLALADESAAGDEARLLWESRAGAAAETGGGALEWSVGFSFADREWRLAVRGPPEGALLYAWLAAGGFLISVLLAGIARAAISARGLHAQVREAMALGSYTLEEKLGEGAMGEVYAAKHSLLARPAAIKLILAETLGLEPAAVEKAIRRFETEARVTASLRSSHTINIYDFGRAEDGRLYYVMELLRGLHLQALVERFGPLDPERTVFVLRQVCHSLAEAHQAGLVHRDIKPANIYLCHQGLDYDFAKVLDFGLVKSTQLSADGAAPLTTRRTFLGTAAFAAPEASLERPLDGRADIYSLGCVAYWMLTGKLVFEAASMAEVLVEHAGTEPVPPSARVGRDFPEGLELLVLACLAKKPADRPQSAGELDRLLGAITLARAWTPELAAAWWREHLPGV